MFLLVLLMILTGVICILSSKLMIDKFCEKNKILTCLLFCCGMYQLSGGFVLLISVIYLK